MNILVCISSLHDSLICAGITFVRNISWTLGCVECMLSEVVILSEKGQGHLKCSFIGK